jgi:hypothetical protein
VASEPQPAPGYYRCTIRSVTFSFVSFPVYYFTLRRLHGSNDILFKYGKPQVPRHHPQHKVLRHSTGYKVPKHHTPRPQGTMQTIRSQDNMHSVRSHNTIHNVSLNTMQVARFQEGKKQ